MINRSSKNLKVMLLEGDGDHDYRFMDDLERQINGFLGGKTEVNIIDIRLSFREGRPCAMVVYEPTKSERELELEWEVSSLKFRNSIYEEFLKEGKSLEEAQKSIEDEE